MSFTLKTEKSVWVVSMGAVKAQDSVWVAFNEDLDHVEASNLDHLIIAINQHDYPEDFK